jgi:hypothetical protein
MRKSAYSAAAVLSSVALLTVGAPTTSQAYTQKELSICYVNETVDQVQDIEIVADGPSFKTASLDAGECARYDVRPGQYKMTLEDIEEFTDALPTSINHCAGDDQGRFRIYVKRMNDTYKAFTLSALLNGQVTTHVKKNRSTTVTAAIECFEAP